MFWLYAQTWLWYLIAFAVGVLLAWLLLVRPQQRRLRTLQGLAGADAGHGPHAEPPGSRPVDAALFESGSAGGGSGTSEPTTEQIPVLGPDGTQTAEIPAQPPADNSVTGEIPVQSDAGASAESTADSGADPDHEAAAASDAEAPSGAAEPAGGDAPGGPDPASPESVTAVAGAAAATSGTGETTPEPVDTETAAAGPQALLTAPASITAGPYAGSALPGPDGAAPAEEFTIKGNEDSMLFHTPDSPYYGRTKAEVWFSRVEDAEAAGFTNWRRKK